MSTIADGECFAANLEAKPVPVLREAWVNLYPHGTDGCAYRSEDAATFEAISRRLECRRIAWWSDGVNRPVPGEDEFPDFLAERFALSKISGIPAMARTAKGHLEAIAAERDRQSAELERERRISEDTEAAFLAEKRRAEAVEVEVQALRYTIALYQPVIDAALVLAASWAEARMVHGLVLTDEALDLDNALRALQRPKGFCNKDRLSRIDNLSMKTESEAPQGPDEDDEWVVIDIMGETPSPRPDDEVQARVDASLRSLGIIGEVKKSCGTCQFGLVDFSEDPCVSCLWPILSNWQPKE